MTGTDERLFRQLNQKIAMLNNITHNTECIALTTGTSSGFLSNRSARTSILKERELDCKYANRKGKAYGYSSNSIEKECRDTNK